jgi:hypothetical protein
MICHHNALAASPLEIDLFGDASYQPLIATGTWAFSVPALGLEGVGLGTGAGVEYFEGMAALSSIRSVLEIDRTPRPLRVHSDSELALQFLQRAVKREPLPTRKSFDRVRPLYDLAIGLAAKRRIVPVRVAPTRPEHGDCHRRAAKKLRHELATNPTLAWQLALRTEQHRLEALVKEQTTLQLRLEALEEQAVLIGTRIRALSQDRPERALRPEHECAGSTPGSSSMNANQISQINEKHWNNA